MKLYLGDKERIDFSEPIQMTLDQKQKFIKLLKEIYNPTIVLEEKVTSFREDRLGDKQFGSEWSPEEYSLILDLDKTLAQLSNELGRSYMAVMARRGSFISDYKIFNQNKPTPITHEEMIQRIKEFLDSKKCPSYIQEIMDKIKQTKQWWFYIKSDKEIIFKKLEPKPKQEHFNKAINQIKKTNEYKQLCQEWGC